METEASIKVSYWVEQDGDVSLYELEGAEQFRNDLADSYISVVQSRPGDLGGLHELAVEFVSRISLVEVAKFLLEGIAFDMIKAGTKAFVLRPFMDAYRRLKAKNTKQNLDLGELRIIFQDSTLVIFKIAENSIFTQVESILRAVAKHSANLTLSTGERPFEIFIPVFEDPSEKRSSRFRTLLDVDETIRDISTKDYLRYWGARYDFARTDRVYDLENQLLIDERFSIVF